MFTILEDYASIKATNKLLIQKLMEKKPQKFKRIIGMKYKATEDNVYWFPKYGFWFIATEIKEESKYWNSFGVQDPIEISKLSITCQFNVRFKGLDRAVGGAFAKDEFGQLFLVHRGKIGGGREGICKALFDDKYTGAREEVLDGERYTEVAIIGALESSNFIPQLSDFVKQVSKIKANATPQKEGDSSVLHSFNKEFSGIRKLNGKKRNVATCNHGIIVNSLAGILKEKGIEHANNINHDLYIFNNRKRITSIFEIKTSVSRSNIYGGVGQLLINSSQEARRPKLVLVLPEHPGKEFEDILNKLKIQLLLFKMRGGKAIFDSTELQKIIF